MPHLLAADLAATGNEPCAGWPATHARTCWPAAMPATAHDLAADLHQHWRDGLGDDHEDTLAAANYLGWALRDMGRYAEARELDEDTLARRRRVLGEDHPDPWVPRATSPMT